MFKPIPKPNITIRPFKVYKKWTFDKSTIFPHAVNSYSGSFEEYADIFITGSDYKFNEYVLDKSVRQLYYNNSPQLIGVITNWNLAKHNSKQIYNYVFYTAETGTTLNFRYYFDYNLAKYIDEFQTFLDENNYFVTDRGQVLANRFSDITKLYGLVKNMGSIQERRIGNRFIVMIVPQKYVGEEIRPGSVRITDYGRTKYTFYGTEEYVTIVDDGFGNLYEDQNDYIGIRKTDMMKPQNEVTSYQDENKLDGIQTTEGLINRISVNNLDFGDEATKQTEELNYNINGYVSKSIEDIDRMDYQNSFLVSSGSEDLPYPIENPRKVIGNVFYGNGIITITHQTELNKDCVTCDGQENSNFGHNNYLLSFQSTKTIYENEIFLQIRPNEFNVSTNPTATTFKNGAIYINDYIQIDPPPNAPTIPGAYDYDFRIQSTIDSNKKIGFSDFEKSSSIDPTGSYLAPYVTTIGLYDDEYSLIAVAKVPVKPKIVPNYPLNFIIRFDT